MGVGHPNGSLWSIAVELQFYVILPILLFLINQFKKRIYINLALMMVYIGSVLVTRYVEDYQNTYLNIYNISIIRYLNFFITGILIYKNFDKLEFIIKNKVLAWLLVYFLYSLLFHAKLNLYNNPYDLNIFGIIANWLLAFLTLSFAFSYENLSKRLLKRK